MFVDFFIRRPVFSIVCALIILLVGAIAIPSLPVDQFPDISPIQVSVTSNYPGASAEVVESAVTTILERQINGVEGLRYLSSSSSNDGTSTITATFEADRNKDIAAVDVQNRISSVTSQLPETVQQTGVQVTKQSNNILLGIGLYGDKDQYSDVFLSNYADLYLADALKRVEGVSDVRIFGERRYSMRLWLNPEQLASRNLVVQDVVTALREQNIQVGAGRIGQSPTPKEQLYQIDLRALGRLQEPTEFENITIREENGTLIKLRDVGRAELGAENYNTFLRYKGKPAVGLGIFPTPGSNAIDVATGVRQEIAKLSQSFPPGLTYEIAFDTTLYIKESLSEVQKTLLTAVGLVVVVIFIFLQDWRTTLIPVITIPLSLVGTFAFVKAFNFSINSLTLFGLTLATGMVVDDAIIVVENISRYIQDKGMRPMQAASEAMRELASAVIATSLVLMAVFIPVAFFPGTTGALYQQFALTIAFSIAISTFLALTLTPSLCALLLRQGQHAPAWIAWFFNLFNRGLDWVRLAYQRSLRVLVRFKAVVIGLFILSLGATVWLYLQVPQAFLPDEDQGYFITIVQAPEGVSLNYTDRVMQKVEDILLNEQEFPEVSGTFAVGGFGFSGSTANTGVIFTPLKPWAERSSPEQSAQALVGRVFGKVSSITEARVLAVNPPSIQGVGSFGGFQFQLQDRRGSAEIQTLLQSAMQLIGQANAPGTGLQQVFTQFAASTPQFEIDVNRDLANSLGISVDTIFTTLQTALGSQYVNDFNLGQRSYRVYVQADQQFRGNPNDIGSLYVRSAQGDMVPLSNLVSITPKTGAQTINHFNLFRAIEISGNPAPGVSSGNAIQAMQQLANQILPPGFGYEWAGTALEEVQSGGSAPLIFGLGIVFVFLVLAAQYENFIDPLIIMLAVPLAVFGALLAQSLRGLANDIYCQIGLVMLIGLASKNSILIVEFANQLRAEGLSTTKAAIEAAQERLRPILMTAFSTLLGIYPLTVATGAGAGSRISLGTAVFGGMLIATFLSLFIVPMLYIVITGVRDRLFRKSRVE
ncbi:efflux RND transporter permease subunit [Pantanalinema rosaneae CENA516]|uniref:efflux RND transporter permease subunit n=1 Tax=Pantanalinema rosaneae TaxID=1620701 RepID=UPI003D6EE7A8